MNKHEALAAAVTGIDDELLQEAANGLPAPRRPVFARWGAMAAALLLVFGISVLWQQSGALRLSVGNTVIGSRSVPVTQSAAPRTVEEPVMYSDEPLELTLSLSCRGEWQLAVSAGEVQITQGPAVSAWGATQQGSGACTVSWRIPQPMAGQSYRMTVNTQTMTLSQNEQGVWTIQKIS